ncbi:MAG: hypothetical protein MJ000_10855 [Bacteroidales bacterium]|nr:hypothetical protein [Bacteroidales bacterium]
MMIKCDECGNYFTPGNDARGLANGAGFKLTDGTIWNVCRECIEKTGEKIRGEIKPKSDKKGEIAMHALHIKQESFDKVMTPEPTQILKKFDACVLAMSKNPILYCATFLFKDKDSRDKCAKRLEKLGIKCVKEKEVAYVERKWLP